MKKSRKFIVSLISGVCASVFMIASASADYSPSAKALGFNLEKNSYKNIGWVTEHTVKAYVVDESAVKRHCGTLTTQTLYATSKTKYLLSNQMDVWLTRTITEARKTKYNVHGFWFFMNEKNISFATSKVVENETMPKNIKLANYMATSPSQVITKFVTNGWGINKNASISYNNIEIGSGTMGRSWSSTSDVILCTTYNESRTNRFKVTYNILDPYYNTMNGKQRSYCYGLNYFYTAKSVYGTTSAMKKYLAPSNTTAYFRGYYTGSTMNSNYTVPVDGSANISFSATIGA